MRYKQTKQENKAQNLKPNLPNTQLNRKTNIITKELRSNQIQNKFLKRGNRLN